MRQRLKMACTGERAVNDFWTSPRSRLLCAESLERRWLLSGDDVEVELSELPETAIKAFQTRFPGAEIVEAEIADDGIDARMYEITGELNGREVELAFPYSPEPTPEPDPLPPEPVTETPVTMEPPAATPPAAESTANAVEVVEVEVADEGDEVEIAIAPSELPAHIRLALAKRFPGAELIEAEFSTGEDESEYGVTAEFNDQLIDVSLTPEGQITEIEQSVTSGDLPEAVLAWIRAQFPDAVIDEAAIVDESGEVSYEVEFTPAGQAPLEATLRVPGVEPPSVAPEPPADEVATGQMVPTEAADDVREQAAGEASSDAQDAADSAATADSQVTPAQQLNEPKSASPDSVLATKSTPDNASTVTGNDESVFAAFQQAAAFAEVLQAVATANPDWFPELTNALPIDIGIVEQNIREILAELDALAGQLAGGTPENGLALRLAVALAVLAGVELFLLESRKTRGGPAVVFNGAASTWSWLVGNATRTHHRSDE